MNREFGPYDISQELGRGAMGVVYLATHRNLQRECALKTIALKFKDPHAAERFIHEGQAVAKLGKHPNIVQVFDAGIVEKTPYIAMELVKGETLDALAAQRGAFPESELIELGRKIALALDHAHRRGIVHRDVKLANVIMDDTGEPQLVDFGIAKNLNVSRTAISELSVSSVKTQEGASGSPAECMSDTANDATFIVDQNVSTPSLEEGIQGTPAFMAPEQADPRRGPVDSRSDVYALGVTLYVLATARRPFEAATITELLVRVVTEPPPSPRLFADVSLDFEAVVLKSLEKSPADRYQTALEFADDLSRVSTGMPTRARKLGKLGWLLRRLRAHGKLVAIASVFLIFAIIVSSYFLYRSREIQALWGDIAERTARATAREVDSLLDPALPMLEECVSLAETGLLPIDDQELLAQHLVARFRYQKKLSWLSYGDAQGRFTGAWRHASGRIVVQRSWIDEEGGHVREEFVDGEREHLRWNDNWTYDPRTRPFYHLAAEANYPIWTKPYEWFGEEGLGITSAFAFRNQETHQVQGVFTADYHLGALADFLAQLKIGKHGRAYLLRRSGELLASPERGTIAPDDLLRTAIQTSERTLGGIQNLEFDEPGSFSFQHEGKSYVAAFEAFEPADGLPVVTAVLVPEEDITGPVKAAAVRTAQMAGSVALLAICATVIAGIYQKRNLIKALAQRKRKLKQSAVDASLEKTSVNGSGQQNQTPAKR
ncbi:serine/threonine protein kinase [Schlesneria paludicola]|uniref:serine/threonine protein kinase n=1 Tax=Schlesneria paludicola TaxID=360056 RepID=UPI00029A3EAA|nr:serine/threonine protein kinase [Schlesneria paludicola]